MPEMTHQTIYQVQKQVVMTSRKTNGLNMLLNAYRKLLKTDLVYFLSAFNDNKTGSPTTNPDTTAMMSMFCEDSQSDAMIKRSMDIIWQAVNHLNKGQPIVVVLDQP